MPKRKKPLQNLFETGDYDLYSADLELVQAQKDREKTLLCVQGMLDSIDGLSSFTEAPLYSHLPLKKASPEFVQMVRKNLLDTCRTDESFTYMQKDPRWEALLSQA